MAKPVPTPTAMNSRSLSSKSSRSMQKSSGSSFMISSTAGEMNTFVCDYPTPVSELMNELM